MTNQTVKVDAILSALNLTGTIGDIDDDPDSPDANWIDHDSTADCTFHGSFSAITVETSAVLDGNQVFKALFRKNGGDTGGGNPSADLYLWSAGVSIATLGGGTIADTASVVSVNWDASQLKNPRGDTAEIYIRITTDGGGPNANTLDIGAIEWSASAIQSVAGGAYNAVPVIFHNYRNMGY